MALSGKTFSDIAGTLTRATGSGDAMITFSAFSQKAMLFLAGYASTFATNLRTGGGMTLVSGAIADANDRPGD